MPLRKTFSPRSQKNDDGREQWEVLDSISKASAELTRMAREAKKRYRSMDPSTRTAMMAGISGAIALLGTIMQLRRLRRRR